MTTFGFKFIYALTLIHTLFTLVGMQIFSLTVSPQVQAREAQGQCSMITVGSAELI